MRITAVEVYGVELVQKETTSISGGRTISAQQSTIVALRTDVGLTGWGESAPWSPTYLPTSAGAIRASIELMATALLGRDPTMPTELTAVMDANVRGQEQAKSAIDVASWDLLGKSLSVPLHTLFGGRRADWLPAFGFIHRENGVEAMIAEMTAHRANGINHFKFKASGDASMDAAIVGPVSDAIQPHEMLTVDANGGWSVDGAVHVMSSASKRTLFEQPCETYERCLALRNRVSHAISLDEVVVSIPELCRAIADGVMDVFNLKIARVGGLSTARAMRDICVAYGIPLIVQCVGGSEFSTAAIAHLASTIPAQLLLYVWDGTAMLDTRTGEGLETNGRLIRASTRPGLGIEPFSHVLGDPLFVIN